MIRHSMKKVASSVLAGTIAMGLLAGCGSTSSTATTEQDTANAAQETTTQTGHKGEIEFWNDKIQDAEVETDVSDTWSSASGYTIAINTYTDTASYQTAMSQSIDSSSAPDLFTWWSGEQLQSLVENGKVQPVDDVWDNIVKAGAPEGVKSAFTFDGKAYATPFSVLYNECIYNVEAFDKAGITSTPTTFNEFLEDCQKLKDAGITPISLKNDSWASFIWFEALIAAEDPELYKGVCDGSIKYTDDKVKEVFSVWQDMIDKGYFADPVALTDHDKRFSLGECAILIEPQSEIASLVNNNGMVPGKNLDAFVLPSMNGGKSTVFFEASPICIPTAIEDATDAKKALEGYYSEDVQKVTSAKEGILLNSNVESDIETITKINASAGDDNNECILRYYENTPSELRDVALDEMSKFMAGRQDAESTLANIQAKADTVFGK